MKKIVYEKDGRLCIIHPQEGARLAFFITLEDGTRLPSGVAPFVARPVDSILRKWPVEGVVAEWAESEQTFVERIASKDLPALATNVYILDESAIPADRSERNRWRLVNGRIVVGGE